MSISIELTADETDALVTVRMESYDEYSNAIEEYSDDSENDWSMEIEDCKCRQDAIDKLLKELKNAVS